MSDKIQIEYKGFNISFNTDSEEWIAVMEEDSSDIHNPFKKNSSLKKLKDSIDRFLRKNFTPIPIILFPSNDKMRNAEIISFTKTPGECWIKYDDGQKEKINTIKNGFSTIKKIYACGNINNEPILIDIINLQSEIELDEKNILQKKKNKIHLISTLQTFNIDGYVELDEENEF